MTFAGIAIPQFLTLFGALAGATILIFLLLQRRRGQEISSLLVWKRVTGSRRSIWHDLLSLLLQLLFLLLLTLALTDPQVVPEEVAPRRVAFVVDSSASMGAKYKDSTRIEAAQAEVAALSANLGEADRAMVIAAGADLKPLTTFTASPADLDAAAERIVPRGSDDRLGEGIEYAVSALELTADEDEGAERRVVVLTDHEADLSRYADETGVAVEQLVLADPRQNLGITAFDVRKTFNLTPGHEVLIRVANTGYADAGAQLELATSRYVVGRANLDVAARTEIQRVFYLPFGVSGKVRARLSSIRFDEGDDGLAADNECFALLPEQAQTRVALVAEKGRFIGKSLRANPQVALREVRPDAYSAGAVAGYDLVIFDNVTAPRPNARNVLYVNPTGDESGFTATKAVEKPVFSGWDAEHPLLRYVVLKDLNVPEAHVLAAEPGDETLIGTLDGALFLIREQGGKRTMAIGFDLERSDLPLRVGFPVMMHNLVTWIAESTRPTSDPAFRVGETASIKLAETESTEVELSHPDGATEPLPVVDGKVSFTPLTPGFYSIVDGERTRLVPVVVRPPRRIGPAGRGRPRRGRADAGGGRASRPGCELPDLSNHRGDRAALIGLGAVPLWAHYLTT